MFESLLKEELKERIKKIKENISSDLEKEYLDFLECSLKDISATNGGYFSNDNSTNDEEIQKEMRNWYYSRYWNRKNNAEI